MNATASPSASTLRHKTVTLAEFRSLIEADKPTQVVDVRSHDEFDAGHIPGAINIPMDEIEARIDDLAASGELILVCQSGQRAGMTCQLLASTREHVAVLDGGTDAWVRDGLSVVRTSSSRWSLERQVRLGAGLLVLISFLLAFSVSPWWLGLALFVGCGLTFAGLSNLCLMAAALGALPWNKPKR